MKKIIVSVKAYGIGADVLKVAAVVPGFYTDKELKKEALTLILDRLKWKIESIEEI